MNSAKIQETFMHGYFKDKLNDNACKLYDASL